MHIILFIYDDIFDDGAAVIDIRAKKDNPTHIRETSVDFQGKLVVHVETSRNDFMSWCCAQQISYIVMHFKQNSFCMHFLFLSFWW